MSVPVALDELARRVEEFGDHPFLVTTSPEGKAHVVSVSAGFDGQRFSSRAGRTSRSNVAGGASVTLLWPGNGGPYALIVDGEGEVERDEIVAITPARAVLHRLSDAPESLPSCVPIEPAS
jgi:hypothetical protein